VLYPEQAEGTESVSVLDLLMEDDLRVLMAKDTFVLLWVLWTQRCPSAQLFSKSFLDDLRPNKPCFTRPQISHKAALVRRIFRAKSSLCPLTVVAEDGIAVRGVCYCITSHAAPSCYGGAGRTCLLVETQLLNADNSYKYEISGQATRQWHTKRHKGSCRGVEFSPDGSLLVSVGKDAVIKVADTETGKVVSKDTEAHS